jgi:hypothetical protein
MPATAAIIAGIAIAVISSILVLIDCNLASILSSITSTTLSIDDLRLAVKRSGFLRIESKPSLDEAVPGLVAAVVVVVSFRLCPEKSCASMLVGVDAGNTRKQLNKIQKQIINNI